MVIKSILLYLFSLLGIAGGFVVSMIAIEELKTGKKYFTQIRRILFVIILLFILYNLIDEKIYLLGIILTLMFSTLLLIQLRTKKMQIEIANYFLFFLVMLLLDWFGFTSNIKYIFTSLIIIYGIIIGTQLHTIFIFKNSKIKNDS